MNNCIKQGVFYFLLVFVLVILPSKEGVFAFEETLEGYREQIFLEESAKRVVWERLHAEMDEDKDRYLTTVPLKDNTKELRNYLDNVFSNYDMRLEVLEFSIIEVSKDKAVVGVKLKSEKVSGPVYLDNISMYHYNLVMEGAGFKIRDKELIDFEYINGHYSWLDVF